MAYERKDIDRKEVLTLLGRMYALTATGKGIAETAEQIRIAAKKRYYAKKERDGNAV